MGIPMAARNKKKSLLITGVGAVAAGLVAFGMLGTASAEPQQTPPANAAMRAAGLAQEQRTASCMSARGLEYVAAVPNDVLIDEAYQAATAEGKQGEQLQAAMVAAEATLPEDPNVQVVAQMPASRVAAWNDALAGTEADLGCAEPAVVMTAEEQAELTAQTDRAEQAIAAAPAIPAVKNALTSYKTCMSAAGYTVTDTEQIDEILQSRAAGYRTAEESWPEEPAEDASAAVKAAYAARVAVLEQRDVLADDIVAEGNRTHETCVVPYDEAFAAAYARLTN
jgi:hypothetical protein